MRDERIREPVLWLSHALGDLAAARAHRGRRVPPRTVAFSAQHAAEKALKAALIMAEVVPPRTRDLDDLRNRLPTGWRVKVTHQDLARLSDYAVDSRYPDDITPVTPLQAATAVRQAMAIIASVRQDFERRDVPTVDLRPR